MANLQAPAWKDYELIDCGNFEKLERFGPYTLIRPEPQALWNPKLSEKEWRSMAQARYVSKTSTSGDWDRYGDIRTPWTIKYQSKNLDLAFRLKFTAFKHLGVFPEQAANWEYLYQSLKNLNGEQPKVLNLFAYTGGASLAAKAAGADIIHLDSVKPVVNWAAENMESSKLKDIRWVVEDAAKFVQREVKRGRKYNAIIMDPPSYGLGPSGERWKLEESINEMMKNALSLLDRKQFCYIINTYSLNLSSLILRNLVESHWGKLPKDHEYGELYLQSREGMPLPLGSYFRMSSES